MGKGFVQGPSHNTAGEGQAQGTGPRAQAPDRRLAAPLEREEAGTCRDLTWGGWGWFSHVPAILGQVPGLGPQSRGAHCGEGLYPRLDLQEVWLQSLAI